MSGDSRLWIQVAIPRPVTQLYTYIVPSEFVEDAVPGNWVRLSFGRSWVYGYIVTTIGNDDEKSKLIEGGLDPALLKEIVEIGDRHYAVPAEILSLAEWVQRYYQAPLGEVLMAAASPSAMGAKTGEPKRARKPEPILDGRAKVEFSDEQKEAVAAIEKEFERVVSEKIDSSVLIDGVTGSGKTEIYLHAIRLALSQERGAIVLVPEIALTSQLHERIESGAGERVGIWHSQMSDGSRRDLWRALIDGTIRVVVGARSAIFAPVKNLGLIVVDEEHDSTYKQEDRIAYSARDIAYVRARLTKALTLHGSATPSLESRERIERHTSRLVRLTKRVGRNLGEVPEIDLVDLRTEPLVEGLRTPLAERTLEKIKDTVARGEQAMIYLNRRGYAPILICEECGDVTECEHCSISMTYYQKGHFLRCHLCGTKKKAPVQCAKCSGSKLRPEGIGTEGLEDELEKILVGIKIARLDRDKITSHSRLEKTLNDFRDKKTQVLIGTQMLVKGHDFSGVTLVVVILADALFRFPDFRAQERAYQTLVQVAGRAGRGGEGSSRGDVYVQTYQPDHPVLGVLKGLTSVSDFIEGEREIRRELKYPPFGRLSRLRLEAKDDDSVKALAQGLGTLLEERKKASDMEIEILGPGPATVFRVQGKYRYDLFLKGEKIEHLHRLIREARQYCEQHRSLLGIDVDYG